MAKNTPRIAVVRHECYPLDQHLRRDLSALLRAGFEVDLICDAQAGKPRIERSERLTIIRLPPGHTHGGVLRYLLEYTLWPLLAAATLALRSLHRRYEYVEIRTMPDWLVVASLVPKMLGATVVLYMLENMPELFASDYDVPINHPVPRILLVLERLSAKLADRIIAAQEMLRQIMVRQGLPAYKMTVVPNAPDEAIFLSRVHESLLATDSRPEGPSNKMTFRLATHGSILERYGIQTLLEALALVRHHIPGLHLDILGDGEYRPTLEAQARDLQLDKIVTFHGFLPFEQVAPHLLNADVGVVAMWVDGMPNKLTEYLALGIPVIAADRPSMRAYFDDDALYYVEPRNAQALADAIYELYRDPSRRAQLAARGREVFYEKVSWSRNVHTYVGVYGGSISDSAPDHGDGQHAVASYG